MERKNILRNKRILFEIAHPKHVYQFEKLINKLNRNNEILVLARDKDVTVELLKEKTITFEIYGSHGKNLFSKLLFTPKILFDYIKVLSKSFPDLIISKSSPYSALLSLFLPTKTVIMPDAEVVPIINHFVAPCSDMVITPRNFAINYGDHHKRISSFFEYGYLNPDNFRPNPEVLEKLNVRRNENFTICRFVGWTANHDIHQYGLTENQKGDIVNLLAGYGKVFISSESKLPRELEQYRLDINPSEMHSVLYYSSLYVGDSQTMATEAALLGTPSIRYSSFVGKDDMSNFIELEKLGMLYNYDNFDNLFDKIRALLLDENRKDKCLDKRDDFFSSDIDINREILSFLAELLDS